jgi:hypothetical protein
MATMPWKFFIRVTRAHNRILRMLSFKDRRDRAAQKVFARAGSRKPRSDQHQECSTTDNHGYRRLARSPWGAAATGWPATRFFVCPKEYASQPLCETDQLASAERRRP